MKFSLITIFFIGTTAVSFAQDVVFNREYFFGRQPSAKAEALGRTCVADDGPAASMLWANAAGLGFSTTASVYGSYATPYYYANEMRYAYGAATARVGTRIGIGLGYRRMDYGPMLDPWDESTTTYTVGMGYRMTRGLSAGLAVEAYDFRTFNFDGKLAYLVNPGFQYRNGGRRRGERIFTHHRFGISANNVNAARLHGSFGFTGEHISKLLPLILRAGGAYVFELLPDSAKAFRPVVATISAEYEGPLNYNYDHSVKGGLEILVYDLLALRCGYYTTNVFDYGNPQYNKNKIEDFTYGVGLKIAGQRISKALRSYVLRADYCSLPQVSYTTTPRPVNNIPFQSVSVSLTYQRYRNVHKPSGNSF